MCFFFFNDILIFNKFDWIFVGFYCRLRACGLSTYDWVFGFILDLWTRWFLMGLVKFLLFFTMVQELVRVLWDHNLTFLSFNCVFGFLHELIFLFSSFYVGCCFLPRFRGILFYFYFFITEIIIWCFFRTFKFLA